jgi:hypothetical protein
MNRLATPHGIDSAATGATRRAWDKSWDKSWEESWDKSWEESWDKSSRNGRDARLQWPAIASFGDRPSAPVAPREQPGDGPVLLVM